MDTFKVVSGSVALVATAVLGYLLGVCISQPWVHLVRQ